MGWVVGLSGLLLAAAAAQERPENLARTARVAASSVHSEPYAAAGACDGRIPAAGGKDDAGAAWCAKGNRHPEGVEFSLAWDEPVLVAEIVYFGRTSFDPGENWKDVEVFLDAAPKPQVRGRLRRGQGPQRIPLAVPARARRLLLRFTSSWGGPNPGAAEIEVYAAPLPDARLGRFVPAPELPAAVPDAPRLDPETRRGLLDGPLEGAGQIVYAARAGGRDGHWYANFSYYARDTERKCYGKPGGKLCRLDLRSGMAATLLEDPAGSLRDPQLSYDGRRILFSYRPGDREHFNLYEIGVDGTGLRRITEGDWDDIEPSYLPDGGIVFCSSRCRRWVNCWLTQVAVLYRCDADGGNLRPLSSNNEHDNTPWVLPDGRILHTRWEYVDRSQVDFHHLWTMNPDGTGQSVYYGNMLPGVVMIDAKPVPGRGEILAVFSPGHGRAEHEGPLYLVDASRGPDDPAGARPFGKASGRDPYPISADWALLARGRAILLAHRDGRLFTLHEDPALELHEPRVLAGRPREPALPHRVRLEAATGQAVLADVNTGRYMAGVAPGEIRKLLVLETLPKPVNYTGGMDPLTYGGSFTLERVVGTVPVEPDGSAYFELPALRSFFFVALDKDDLSVKRMHSFVTVQPGERLGCVGCHEQRTRSALPPNLLALARPPSPIRPVAGVPDVLDFPRDIQPVLDRHCVSCHDYRRHPGGTEGPRAGDVVLTGDRGPMFSHSYVTLTVRRQFADGRNEAAGSRAPRSVGSSASPLMAKLVGGHYGVRVSPRELDLVRCWIETGAPYPGTYAALGTGSIGGYDENRQVELDTDWPAARAAGEAIGRRCSGCHTGERRLPRSLSDENGLSFWRPDWKDPRLLRTRHLIFNLTRPELSLALLAPLSKEAGGLGACGPAAVFESRADADYAKILALCEAGRRRLEAIGRFDMPGFVPDPAYVREMKRYGVLAPDVGPKPGALDVYAIDQAYWRSLWWVPRAGADRENRR